MKQQYLKNQILLILVFIGTLFSVNALEWNKVEIDFKSAMVGKLYTIGKYQLALLRNNRGLYRRSISDDNWKEIISPGKHFPTDHLYYPQNKIDGPNFIEHCNSYLFVYDGSLSYYSVDSGATWLETDIKLDLNKKTLNIDSLWYDSYGLTVRSSDKMGIIWDSCFTTNSSIYCLSSYKKDLWVGAWGEIYHWNRETLDTFTIGLPERCPVNYLKQVNDSMIFAQTDVGLFESHDTGKTWLVLNENFSDSNYNMVRDIISLDSSALFLTDKGLFRYLYSISNLSEIDISFNLGIRISDIDTFNNKYQLAGYNGIYESPDNGITWKKLANGITNNYLKIDEFEVNDSTLVVEVENSNHQSIIFKGYSDGSDMNRILTTVSTVSNINLHNNNIYIGDPYCSSNPYEYNTYMLYEDSDSWAAEKKEYHPQLGLFHIYGDTVFSRSGFSTYLSYDNGENWEEMISGHPVNGFSKVGSRIILSFPKHKKYASQFTVYSDDFFETSTGYMDNSQLYNRLKSYSGIYWFHDTLWTKNRSCDAYIYSTDTATTWSMDSVFKYFDMSTLTRGKKTLFVKHNYGLMYSNDDGYNWTLIEMPFSKLNLNLFKVNNKNLYISSESEIYYIPLSTFNDPIPVVNVPSFDKNNSIKFYMNSGKINLHVKLQKGFDYSATLINSSGRKIRKYSGSISEGTNLIKLDISNIAQGYYVLHTNIANNKINKPFLILK